MKRGGRNQKSDPPIFVSNPSVRQKDIKRIWVNKEELNENFPLPMCNQGKTQTRVKKKQDGIASIRN